MKLFLAAGNYMAMAIATAYWCHEQLGWPIWISVLTSTIVGLLAGWATAICIGKILDD